MENMQNPTYIGNYRIRYKGESLTVPVDDKGNLYLPDGKVLRLSDEQFSIVRQKIEERRAIENNAKSMTMPTADELTRFYSTPKAESTQGFTSPATVSETPVTEPPKEAAVEVETPATPDKKELAEKEKAEKRLAAEEEKARKRAEAEALKAEKKAAQEAAKAEKAAALEAEKAKKKAEKEEAERVAREKKAAKQKEKEEKRASVNQATRLSLIATALASVLITVVVLAGLFLYFVNSGFITINSSPRINGLVIYDDLNSTASASTASFDVGDTAYLENVDIVSL